MDRMILFAAASLLVLAGIASGKVLAQDASAPASEAAVTVDLGDFDQMRELKFLRGTPRRDTERAIQTLSGWLEKRAGRLLPEGQRLQITLRDVDLSGDYFPGRRPDMDHVRIVKDTYPPRIELSWRLEGADGAVLDEGETVLTDLGFTLGSPNTNDPLRHEKRMLGNWLREHLPQP